GVHCNDPYCITLAKIVVIYLSDCGFTGLSHDGIMRQSLSQDPFCLIDGHPNLK
ncbi:hypothetical protein QZH41_014229, partial [Actinostola sp. cb2023]